MADGHSSFCPDDKISSLLEALGVDERRGQSELGVLLKDFPDDARLHFLKGSVLAGKQELPAALIAMRHAVQLAPSYDVARFQLGLMLLSSGEPVAAQEVWGPLHALPQTHYLYLFARGLCRMIQDDFGEAARLLEDGIGRNTENAPMNRDMQMILDEMAKKTGGDGGGATSSVDFLLQQSALRPRK